MSVAAGGLIGQVAKALRNTSLGLASVANELGLPQPMPPLSLIGVDILFEPDVLVEVEANAVIE